jgi:Polyketide cyclase / dehydrase and lipid transport
MWMTRYQDSLPKDALFVKVTRTIARPVAETFAYIVPVDVTHIFPRQGDMPGNVKTTVTSDWGQYVGQTRDTTADDGSSFHETLTALESNKSFGYKVENLTSPAMKGVVDRIEGAWEFTDNGNDTTSIEWFYVLVPANSEAIATIKEKIVARYRGRLENAMNIIKADLEKTPVSTVD